jgi:hypothetical protein
MTEQEALEDEGKADNSEVSVTESVREQLCQHRLRDGQRATGGKESNSRREA